MSSSPKRKEHKSISATRKLKRSKKSYDFADFRDSFKDESSNVQNKTCRRHSEVSFMDDWFFFDDQHTTSSELRQSFTSFPASGFIKEDYNILPTKRSLSSSPTSTHFKARSSDIHTESFAENSFESCCSLQEYILDAEPRTISPSNSAILLTNIEDVSRRFESHLSDKENSIDKLLEQIQLSKISCS
mmetsp:Transcript_6366/g.8644  ORF Transcript_6366/g.8644 Transcript_6366/m.8644 type:complete len:188 (+) Transcript_6366:164-727(+)